MSDDLDDKILEWIAKLDSESQKQAVEFVQSMDARKHDAADWLDDLETFEAKLKAEHGNLAEWQKSLEEAHRKRVMTHQRSFLHSPTKDEEE